MVSEYTIEKRLPIPRHILWRAITSNNRAFMDHLVADGALNRVDSTPIVQVDGGTISEKTRQQVYVPKTIDIPAVVKPVFDDTYLEINDTQHWDEDKPCTLRFSIATAALGDYITMSGVTTFEEVPGDPRSCLQIIRGNCTVDIPFLGWYIEQAICANMDTFYEAYPQHITNFVNKLVHNFEADPDNLLPALERMELAVAQQKVSDSESVNTNAVGSTQHSDSDVNVPGRGGGGGVMQSDGATLNGGPNGLATKLESSANSVLANATDSNNSTTK